MLKRIAVLLAVLVTAPGCVELQRWLFGPDNTGFDNSSFPPPANDNGSDNENDNSQPSLPPVVVLSISNRQPSLGEQVDLTCSLVGGGSTAGVIFSFSPEFGTLVVNQTAGTAFFIVDVADVGVERRFTCTGTNLAGEGPESNEILVIPSGGPAEIP